MDQANDRASSSSSFSLARLSMAVLGILLIAGAGYWYGVNSVELPIPNEGRVLKNFGLSEQVKNHLDAKFKDGNGDLLADSPTDPAEQIDPEVILFSYGSEQQATHYTEEVWRDFLDHLSQAIGKPVEFVPIATPQEQVAALAKGDLHIGGANPGSVPFLVNTCGYIPVCTTGNKGEMQSYTMQIIVPAKSPLKKLADLRNRMLTLTDPTSNSGWKAPLVILMDDLKMEPMRDFFTNYSGSHNASIRGIAASEYEAAAVASTEVTLAIQRDEIEKKQIKVIFESDPFPYDCIGYLYNLQPNLAKKIRAAILSFKVADSSLAEEFGPLGFTGFVEISYKDDLATVRKIDDAMGHKHSLETALSVGPQL